MSKEVKSLKSLIVDDELMARKALEHLCTKNDSIDLVHSCESAIEALEYLEKNEIDLLFLDVNMPELSGFDLLDRLPVLPQVILTTGNKEYAFEAFEYDVTDFLKKPITQSRFARAVDKAISKESNLTAVKRSSESEEIYIKADGKLVRIPYSELFYFENVGDYIKVVSTLGTHVVHGTLKSMDNKITHPRLLKVHRSYIVNLSKIKDIEDNTLLIEKKVIPISRAHKSMLMKRLNIL